MPNATYSYRRVAPPDRLWYTLYCCGLRAAARVQEMLTVGHGWIDQIEQKIVHARTLLETPSFFYPISRLIEEMAL